MVSSEADVLNKNVNKEILFPHQQAVQLFCDRGSLEGAIKTIIGTKTDLVFLYMKYLLNSTCPMIHSGIIIVYTYGILPPSSAEASVGYVGGERYCTVFSGKLLNRNWSS